MPWSFHSWTSIDTFRRSTWNHQVSSPSSLFRRRLRSLPFQESFTYRCVKRAIHHELIIPKVMLLIPILPNDIEHCVTFFLNCITLFINPITLFEYCKMIFKGSSVKQTHALCFYHICLLPVLIRWVLTGMDACKHRLIFPSTSQEKTLNIWSIHESANRLVS